VLKKKIRANFQRIIELFTQKLSLSSQKYGFGIRDPRSGKNLFRIPDPGVKKAPDPGSGSATLCAMQCCESALVQGDVKFLLGGKNSNFNYFKQRLQYIHVEHTQAFINDVLATG
jgi:hypothetical protein